jgi:hypothetical protein
MRYKFKKGLDLTTSDRTLNQMKKHGEVHLHLHLTEPFLRNVPFLNFSCVKGKETAEKLDFFHLCTHQSDLKMNHDHIVCY